MSVYGRRLSNLRVTYRQRTARHQRVVLGDLEVMDARTRTAGQSMRRTRGGQALTSDAVEFERIAHRPSKARSSAQVTPTSTPFIHPHQPSPDPSNTVRVDMPSVYDIIGLILGLISLLAFARHGKRLIASRLPPGRLRAVERTILEI